MIYYFLMGLCFLYAGYTIYAINTDIIPKLEDILGFSGSMTLASAVVWPLIMGMLMLSIADISRTGYIKGYHDGVSTKFKRVIKKDTIYYPLTEQIIEFNDSLDVK